MKKTMRPFVALSFCIIYAAILGQGLDPSLLTKPATDSWPTYAGDYSQRRYSSLKQINQANIKGLTLAWISHSPAGEEMQAAFLVPGFKPRRPSWEVRRKRPSQWADLARGSRAILQVNGILYISAPDNAWAVDARDGTVLWHDFWRTKGGTHIGNRGMAMVGTWLFFVTPDDYLISLEAGTGRERWHKEIADFNEEYFLTSAPIAIGNHLIVGTGDDLDAPVFCSFRSGEWRSAVEVLYRPDETGRPRPGHLEEPRCGAPRRRPGLDVGL